jgi:DNA topoisomerase-1
LNVDSYNRTLSIGRVQGPTLAFVVKREIETRTFVPTPFWTITGLFETNGTRITIPYATRVFKRAELDKIREDCEGGEGKVVEIRKTYVKEGPPSPFNTGDLQREAYRVFGYSPSRTLQIAEKLYLSALISYPRTSSRRIPSSIDYVAILRNLGKMSQYGEYVNELLRGKLSPPQSDLDDPAHPAIHPTGEPIRRRLEPWESRLYDLIVSRFLASFSDYAIFEEMNIDVSVNGYPFAVSGRRLVKSGWLRYYTYLRSRDMLAPKLEKGDSLKVLRINSQEDFRAPAPRFNQSSLLQRMEEEGIGTKSTRAETINTLIRRGYISGTSLMATDYGIAVSRIMESYSPQLVSPKLTREVEKKLEAIEVGKQNSCEVLENTIDLVFRIVSSMRVHQTTMGRELSQSLVVTTLAESIIGSCPVCGTGKLRIIRSATTHKRFVGCTNYLQGCRASAPLPQKGMILKKALKTCEQCGWPVVCILNRRTTWKLCINTNCGSKRVKNGELQTLPKRR